MSLHKYPEDSRSLEILPGGYRNSFCCIEFMKSHEKKRKLCWSEHHVGKYFGTTFFIAVSVHITCDLLDPLLTEK